MAREKLKEARRKAGMTQKQVAEHLGITLRSYQRMESGELLGSIVHWDVLEDLFTVHQRELRSETYPAEAKETEDSRKAVQPGRHIFK